MFPPRPCNVDSDDDFLIIDNPEVTMTHPLIVSRIAENVHSVLTNWEIPGPNMKPVFAIVTGKGRGKTRTLVEMDREINSREKALSVAITYTHNWELYDYEFSKFLHYDYRVRFAVTLVTRILSVYYRMEHSEVVRNVVQYLIKRASQQSKEETGVFLIRDCLRYIIRQYRDSDHELETFVLMLDESKVVEEKMNSSDIHMTLRSALLDEALFEGMPDPDVKVELIMSCLDLKSTGWIASRRPIIAITIPEVLTPVKVLDEWWLKITPVELTAGSRFKLLKLISTMNSLPRALQYGAVNFGEMAKKHLSSNIPWDISAEEISQLYGSVREDVAAVYPLMNSWHLSPKLTKALLFCESTKVNDETIGIISQGVFTNTLTDFSGRNMAAFYPKTCILAVDIMSSSKNPVPDLMAVPEEIRRLVASVLKFMASNDSQIGYPLKIAANGLINARLFSLAINAPGNQCDSFTIAQLLLIRDPAVLSLLDDKEEGIVRSTMNYLSWELKIKYTDQQFLTNSSPLRCSCDDKCPELEALGYLEDANDVIPSDVNVATRKLDPEEGHDGVWSFRTWHDLIYTLMIDARSVRELPTATSSQLPVDLKQYTYYKTFDEKIKTFTSNNLLNVNDDSMTHSLKLNKTVFVYLTNRREETKISDRLLLLGDTDTRRFLGFLEPLYAVCTK